jgi:hypothetical protein
VLTKHNPTLTHGQIPTTRLVESRRPDITCRRAENIYSYPQHWRHANLRDSLHWQKLFETFQLCSLPNELSSRNCWGGTAIIIINTIKHHKLSNYSQDYLQATNVSVEDSVGLLTISAVYLPLKHSKARTTRRFLRYPKAPVQRRWRLQCRAYRLGIQIHHTYRTPSTQNNGKKQLKTPVYGRTHILVIWQEQTTRFSGLLCYERHSSRLSCSKIMSWPILWSFPGLDNANNTCDKSNQA